MLTKGSNEMSIRYMYVILLYYNINIYLYDAEAGTKCIEMFDWIEQRACLGVNGLEPKSIQKKKQET